MTPLGPRPGIGQRLRAGELLLGGLLRMPNESLVEMAGLAGFDVVLIDGEHGPADHQMLLHHLRAADAAGVPVFVRVNGCDDRLIQHALDSGAAGIVAPHVESAADARLLASSARFAPAGSRGFASYTRAGSHGFLPADEILHRAEDIVIVAMIESVAATRNVDEVAAVDGIDALMLGPADLAHDARAAGVYSETLLADADRALSDAARTHSKATVSIVNTSEEAARTGLSSGGMVFVNLQVELMRYLKTLVAGKGSS